MSIHNAIRPEHGSPVFMPGLITACMSLLLLFIAGPAAAASGSAVADTLPPYSFSRDQVRLISQFDNYNEGKAFDTLYYGQSIMLRIMPAIDAPEQQFKLDFEGPGELSRRSNVNYVVQFQSDGRATFTLRDQKTNGIFGQRIFTVAAPPSALSGEGGQDSDFSMSVQAPLDDPALLGAGKKGITLSAAENFYTHFENKLGVQLAEDPEYPQEQCFVRLHGEATLSGQIPELTITGEKPGPVTIEILHRATDGTETLLGQIFYKLVPLPNPVISFAGVSSGSIDRKQLLRSNSLEALVTQVDSDAGCYVETYTVSVINGEGATQTWKVKGAGVPENVMQAFKKLSGPKNTVFFDDIQVRCPGDVKSRMVRGVVLRVKE